MIKDVVLLCEICIIHKLNNFIKPNNKQIISKFPLERVHGDITYVNKKIELEEFREKYLLCFTDRFSKMAKCYLINNRELKTVLQKIQDFINIFGKPNFFHSDNGGEFCSNIFKLYCEENDIQIINGAARHPRSQGAVEAFNKNIIQKIRYLKLENKNNFDIFETVDKAVNL